MFNLKKLFSSFHSDKADIVNKGPDGAILFNNTYLPAKRSNEALHDDNVYAESAIEMVEVLNQLIGLTTTSKILDFGSGQGRLANGLLLSECEFGRYLGIDTHEESVTWCKTWIETKTSNVRFLHLPARNERYNPGAKILQELPEHIGKFDVVFLNSVFSHMLTVDVVFYLKELNRILKPGGSIFLTAHIDEDVPDVEENPEDYLGRKSIGALHRVRYEKHFFLDLVKEAGFENIKFLHRAFVRTGQSIVTASK